MLPCNRIIVVGMKAGTAMGLPVGLLVDMKAGTGMGSPVSWSLVWSIFLLFVSNVTESRDPIWLQSPSEFLNRTLLRLVSNSPKGMEVR